MKHLTLIAALALAAGASPSWLRQDSPDQALAGLEGAWRGSLSYVDFGSGARVEIPARSTVDWVGGAERCVIHTVYTDPGHEVHSLDVLGFDLERRRLAESSFDPSRPAQAEQRGYDVVSFELEAADRWSMTLSRSGIDGDREAEFQEVRALDGDRFSSLRRVRHLDDEDAEWFMRHELTLERVDGRPSDARPAAESASAVVGDLVGTWDVDLGNGATTELVIESAGNGRAAGRFYGTAFDASRVSASPRAVHVAFVTSDGSGPYNSTARLRADGSLAGTTHSLGRDFLSVWTATRR